MRTFDTKVQFLKYRVLKEVARAAWDDILEEKIIDIPKMIAPGKIPTMRCCVYKERAILSERIKMAMGGDKTNPNVIEVIDIACDECPLGGYEISNHCRGCLARRCEEVCPKNAIYYDSHQKAHIDKTKCVNCGKCANVCPYNAILNYQRPCETACRVDAISMNKDKAAEINNDKCISCGACIYQCPFGAINDKSYILDVINIIKNSNNNKNYKVYAIVAPSISSQFLYAKLGQVIAGIKKLGFFTVVETALGADMIAFKESQELVEKGFLTSSCCPSFVDYINKYFPSLKQYISHNLSPMGEIAKYIKETDEYAKVIFIGPCTSKKMEIRNESIKNYVDSVITFEELQALFDSKDIELSLLNEEALENASYYGRIFARSGGLTEAVKQALSEQKITDFNFSPITCAGIDECKMALLKKSKNVLDSNFIEGMACIRGCISGAGCLTHGDKNKEEVDKYGKEALEKNITDAISMLK